MLPVFDGGDHLHHNDKGMQAMTDAGGLTALACAPTAAMSVPCGGGEPPNQDDA